MVLNSHADNFARDLFISSTSLRFLYRGIHPALMVNTLPRAPYRTVLVAVDFQTYPAPQLTTRHGYSSRIILDEAYTVHADLIVMGKHSRSG